WRGGARPCRGGEGLHPRGRHRGPDGPPSRGRPRARPGRHHRRGRRGKEGHGRGRRQGPWEARRSPALRTGGDRAQGEGEGVRVRAACLGLLLVLPAAAPSARAGDDLLYEVAPDGNIVFTNTPSRATKSVPGFKTERRSTGAPLPVTDFDPFIEQVASEFQLEPALIKAVALVESGFNPGATSPKGAKGLM